MCVCVCVCLYIYIYIYIYILLYYFSSGVLLSINCFYPVLRFKTILMFNFQKLTPRQW